MKKDKSCGWCFIASKVHSSWKLQFCTNVTRVVYETGLVRKDDILKLISLLSICKCKPIYVIFFFMEMIPEMFFHSISNCFLMKMAVENRNPDDAQSSD